jgi:cytochrome bd ubiquinol oxidase subunit II
MILRAIGPVWDGNEVWLLASGGALFFAFPPLYAASFSGFYLPLMIVLWLLMLRGIGVEMRSHVDDPLWWSFFEFVFSFASMLLAIFFGTAVGNVVRGVPLNSEGYFFEALWIDFMVGPEPGVLDWYTVLTGLLALATLTVHGANYLAIKNRSRSLQPSPRGLQNCILATATSDAVEPRCKSVCPTGGSRQF